MAKQRIFDVLIVAKHAGLRSACRAVLELTPEMRVCGEAAYCGEGLCLFRNRRPDLVVLFLSFRYAGELWLIRQIKRIAPAARVLVLAIRGEADEQVAAHRCREAGADAFVRNTGESAQLMEAVRAVLEWERQPEHPLYAAAEGDPRASLLGAASA
ncbi:MAG: response regulator transcription factor [Pirellulales bacterium]|nr:response regulator transcription factor [Pirellulales bacterium]